MSTQKRIVELFVLLLNHQQVSTKEIADKYRISLRTAQRDIQVVKAALAEIYQYKTIISKDPESKKYQIESINGLQDNAIFLLLKILLASRALNKTETAEIAEQLLKLVSGKKRKALQESIRNELTFMSTIHDQRSRAEKIWSLEQAIQKNQALQFSYIDYEATDPAVITDFLIRPVSIFFDNHYFYLVGLLATQQTYKTFRIDWMEDISDHFEAIPIDYDKRYEHGLKRPITMYAYSGKKTKIQFECYGYIEYIKDQFPSCKVIKQLDKPNEYPFPVYCFKSKLNFLMD